jgi:leucyl aminopeptidase
VLFRSLGVEGNPGKDDRVKALDAAASGALEEQIRLENFKGSAGSTLRCTLSGVAAKQVLLVGVGEGSPTEQTQLLASTAARAATSYGSLAVVPLEESAAHVRAAALGAVLGAYRFTRYLTGDRVPKKRLSSAKILVTDRRSSAVRDAVQAGVALGESVNHARDLVNAPPNDMHPTAMAEFAKEQCKGLGITCKVHDKKWLERQRMQLFLAVNRGSAQPPKMIHMTYQPKGVKGAPRVVFVGKGVTFDAGGLCIKPPKSMLDMKCDMAGGAATIGIVLAAARLGLPVEVHGIVGCTENMLGADAYRPGDVFISKDGKSVEIINTDAEGRLVLADCLAYARELAPDFLIDHATLTGASLIALGPWTSGLFTDDEELASRYAEASAEVGESFWRMPLDKELRSMLKSAVADLKHTGERPGGAITAALFLREFVGDARWMHLDIAGPAFTDRSHGLLPKGGTGFGVLTGARFLESLQAG